MIFMLNKAGYLHQVMNEDLAQTYATMFPEEIYFFGELAIPRG